LALWIFFCEIPTRLGSRKSEVLSWKQKTKKERGLSWRLKSRKLEGVFFNCG
jgi:hypothetical protein